MSNESHPMTTAGEKQRDPLDDYDSAAELFLIETGMMAPGKDCPIGWDDGATMSEREDAWRWWRAGQAHAKEVAALKASNAALVEALRKSHAQSLLFASALN